MKIWTIEEMMAERPCERYTRNVIEKLWAGRERLSLPEILALDISAADRMWVVWRPGALHEAATTALLDKIVTRAVTNHALNCKIKAVEQWAQKWLSGEDRSQAAARAVWAAAAVEAESAAWAAQAAAWAAQAARAQAAAAVWAAVWAARAAARAAWAQAEYDLQILDVFSIIAPSARARKASHDR